MQSGAKKLVEKHNTLNHSELLKVVSHIQRKQGEWILHRLIVEACDVFPLRTSCCKENLKAGLDLPAGAVGRYSNIH